MEFILKTSIYPLEAILNTCYAFTDRNYIFLDTDSRGRRVKVSIKAKKKVCNKQSSLLQGEFINELLHCALRYKISKNNKTIREYIVGTALYSILPAVTNSASESESNLYRQDPLGIAKSWRKRVKETKKL